MLISFVIPVYNRAKILPECIDSLLYSDLKDFEIILVDDASLDGSAALCDQYAKQYPYIHAIHLSENHGPGYARNRGVEAANGDWLFFLDSDDIIYKNDLNKIIPLIQRMPSHVDIIDLDILDEFNGVRWEYPYFEQPELLSVTEYMQKHTMRCCLPLWGHLFRTSLIKYNDLKLPDLYSEEDSIFFARVLRYAQYIYCIPYFFYCYRRGAASNSLITHLQNNYPVAGFELYATELCAAITNCEQTGELIRKEAYIKILGNMMPNVVRFLDQSQFKKQPAIQLPLTPDTVRKYGVINFFKELFLLTLQKYQGRKMYLAPANRLSILLADYLCMYDCTIAGIIDNFAPPVVTPQGHQFPVSPREKASEICGDYPILISGNWVIGTKLEKYFSEHGIQTMQWNFTEDSDDI